MKIEDVSSTYGEGYDDAISDIGKILDELQNPYPKDIFKWGNKESLEFNRGRFNQHCFEVWENCRHKIVSEIADSTGENKNEK